MKNVQIILDSACDMQKPEAYLLYKRALQNGAAGTEAKNTACI